MNGMDHDVDAADLAAGAGGAADEFDLEGAVRRLLAENDLTAEDVLLGLLEGLMEHDCEQREQVIAQRQAGQGGQAGSMSILQAVEMVLAWRGSQNLKRFEQRPRDARPNDRAHYDCLIAGQRSHRQDAACDILVECIEALGAKPFRQPTDRAAA
jgi:hypothetical protein